MITGPLRLPRRGRAAPRGRFGFAFGRRFSPSDRRVLLLIPAFWNRTFSTLFVWDAMSCRQVGRPAPAAEAEALTVERVWPVAPALRAARCAGRVVNDGARRCWRECRRLHQSVSARKRRPTRSCCARRRRRVLNYDLVPTCAATRRRTWLPSAIQQRGPGRALGVVSLPQTVRVYPDIGDAHARRFDLIRARQIVMEKRRAPAPASGSDFESLREFREGDELRDVCWTASGTPWPLVERTYQPERSQTVWIVIDAGRLMRARVDGQTTLDAAVNAGFALAQVALTPAIASHCSRTAAR